MTADEEIKAHWMALQKASAYGQTCRPHWYPQNKSWHTKPMRILPENPKPKKK